MRKKYKLITITHVDTSTGVLSDARGIAEIVRRVSPDTLVIIYFDYGIVLETEAHGLCKIALDAVCAVASEEIRQDEWDIDVVMSATQKGIGAPPGLSVLSASPRAISVFESRKAPATSFYASWKRYA